MAQVEAAESLTLELNRVFQARQENVFRAWIDEDELKHWWGPKGFTAQIETFDPRPGGAYRINMCSPDGEAHWLRGEFKEVTPHDRLVMTWIWEQGDMAGHEMLVTVEFTAIDDATEVRLTHARLPSEGARAAHSQGWESSLDCFNEHLTGS